jgi:hypothetical protein
MSFEQARCSLLVNIGIAKEALLTIHGSLECMCRTTVDCGLSLFMQSHITRHGRRWEGERPKLRTSWAHTHHACHPLLPGPLLKEEPCERCKLTVTAVVLTSDLECVSSFPRYSNRVPWGKDNDDAAKKRPSKTQDLWLRASTRQDNLPETAIW